MRVLFLGMLRKFSLSPLLTLLAGGIKVVGVIVPASELAQQTKTVVERLRPPPVPSQLPMAIQNVVELAWRAGRPVYAVQRLNDPAVLETVRALRPDVGCVACFPWRIPAALLAAPPLGFLNLHPSLLPAYRGPAPLFWIFRHGDQAAAGVTVHFMDEGLDSGDIAAQAPVTLPDGFSGAAADEVCAEAGGRLLAEVIEKLAAGALVRRPQPPGGSYYPWPTPADFTLSTEWPARRAFNFMRGTVEWGQPYRVTVAGEEIALASAVAFDPATTLPAPAVPLDDTIRLQFTPGVLEATSTDFTD
ncbi:MAG: hypothetical protein L0332_20485 [Chloroflexi bacterium]|nr:hypothetical protein [Chloroflexota bacterium]MCI0580281.1 hypothetical protein [Chloroflexota bacterium]MCI0643692.1 hypothetical protein [Chloroflexota bacterium]MCI0729076.1 hypothetical protein [Chloroflexota bacterium]